MLKTFAHFISAYLAMFLGTALWLAPKLDWSNVKDESLFSTRGCVVLGMTIFIFVVNMFAALLGGSKPHEPETAKFDCGGGC